MITSALANDPIEIIGAIRVWQTFEAMGVPFAAATRNAAAPNTCHTGSGSSTHSCVHPSPYADGKIVPPKRFPPARMMSQGPRSDAAMTAAYGQSVVKVTPRALNVAMFCACAVQSIGLLPIAMAVP